MGKRYVFFYISPFVSLTSLFPVTTRRPLPRSLPPPTSASRNRLLRTCCTGSSWGGNTTMSMSLSGKNTWNERWKEEGRRGRQK